MSTNTKKVRVEVDGAMSRYLAYEVTSDVSIGDRVDCPYSDWNPTTLRGSVVAEYPPRDRCECGHLGFRLPNGNFAEAYFGALKRAILVEQAVPGGSKTPEQVRADKAWAGRIGSAKLSLYAQVGLPNASGTNLAVMQYLRAGGPPFVFTLTHSNAVVAQVYSDEPEPTTGHGW